MFYNQNEVDSFFIKNIDTDIYECGFDGFLITEQQILNDMYNDFYKKFNTKYNLPLIDNNLGFFSNFQLILPNKTILNMEKIFYFKKNFNISLHGLVITIATKDKITNKFKPLKKLKEKLEEFDIGYKQHILGSKKTKTKIIHPPDTNIILFSLIYTNNFDFKLILLIIYAFYFNFDKNNNWIESQYFDYIIYCNDNDDLEEWRLNYINWNNYTTLQSKIVKNVTRYIR